MASQKIIFTQGDTPLIKVPITVNTEVVDLTGYTAFFTLTSQASPNADTNAEITLDWDLDDTAIAWFQTTEVQTSPLEPATPYNWDVRLKDPSGDFFATIINGTASINQSYTRRTT